jgi:hypothetical protein
MKVVAAFMGFLCCGSAFAKNLPPARKNFDHCFLKSVFAQLKIRSPTTIDTISERAFQACATEEQAVVLYLNSRGPSPLTSTTLVKIKLDLKAKARTMEADPKKYIR